MLKVFNSLISAILVVVLIFGFSPVALAEPYDTTYGSTEQELTKESNSKDFTEENFGSLGNSENLSNNGERSEEKTKEENNSLSENSEDSSSAQVKILDQDDVAEQVEDYSEIDFLAREYRGSVPEGSYYIASCLNEVKNLDVASASISNGAKVQLYQSNMTTAQQWNISYGQDGYATIANVASGKVLDVASAATSNGTKVQQYASNNTRAQKWVIVPSGTGFVIYSALGNNMVLDVASASTSNGAKIQINQSNGSDAQSWIFDSAEVSYDELDARANASKNLLNEDDVYYIETALASNKVLDIKSASKADGADVQIYELNRTDAQKYRITYDEIGYVTFTNVSSGKVLDVKSASTVPGSKVQQYSSNNSRAQKWIVEQNENGTYTVSSALWPKLSLDIKAASTTNGANVQVYRSNGTLAQQWNFISENELYASLDQRAIASKDLLDVNDTYYIETAVAKNKVLDIASGSKDNGANVQIYDFNLSTAQQYKISYDEKGYATFTNVGSGKLLNVESGVAKPGTNVQQYSSSNSRADKWIIEKNENGTYTISSALWPDLVLDVKAGSSSNKANVQIYSGNDSSAQQWNFISENELYASLDAEANAARGLLDENDTYYIETGIAKNKVVDIASGSKDDGANAQLYDFNMSPAQQYRITYDEKRLRYLYKCRFR